MWFIVQNLLAALLPAGVDLVKQGIGKLIGTSGPQPTNITEVIQLEEANVKRIAALAALDNPYGVPSQWVVDLRASFRYLAAGIIILGGVSIQFVPELEPEFKIAGLDFAGMAFSFVFGDRVNLSLKAPARK